MFVVLTVGVMSGLGASFAFNMYKKRKPDRFFQLPHEGRPRMQEYQGYPHPQPFAIPVAQEQAPTPMSNNRVYVLHHDSNRAPVTIIHQDGAEVVELPPAYPESRRQSEAPAGQGIFSPVRPAALRENLLI